MLHSNCPLFKDGNHCPKIQYCNYPECRERLLYEIFKDEILLDIPIKLRLHNVCPELYNGQTITNSENYN